MRVTGIREFRNRVPELVSGKELVFVTKHGKLSGLLVPLDQPDELPVELRRELLERIDDRKGTAIYIDPPYIKKGAKYIHDFEQQDHIRLAQMLGRFKETRIIVSYYDHPKLAELYPDWGRVEITVTKSLDNQNRRDKENKGVKVVEVLLVNGPLEQKGLFK